MSFLVALEGIDGSGKGTQAARLRDNLARSGTTALVLSFPRYEQTRFGRAVGAFLNGQFGTLDDVHPQLAALLFAGDRFESKPVITDAADRHDVVIFDRYVASNVAHQTARTEEPERTQLREWIEAVEFDVYDLPHPDLTILLDMPPAQARALIGRKVPRSYTSKPADLHEADGDYLQRVQSVYLELAAQTDDWVTIACCGEEGLRSVDDIAEEVFQTVERRRSE